MNSILNWFLMILLALWGTSMAAMTPLVSSAGPEFVFFKITSRRNSCSNYNIFV